MNKCYVLSGLLTNLIGVMLLFFGLRVDNKGAYFSNIENGKIGVKSYPVRAKTIFLNIGLALVFIGIILQIVGTY